MEYYGHNILGEKILSKQQDIAYHIPWSSDLEVIFLGVLNLQFLWGWHPIIALISMGLCFGRYIRHVWRLFPFLAKFKLQLILNYNPRCHLRNLLFWGPGGADEAHLTGLSCPHSSWFVMGLIRTLVQDSSTELSGPTHENLGALFLKFCKPFIVSCLSEIVDNGSNMHRCMCTLTILYHVFIGHRRTWNLFIYCLAITRCQVMSVIPFPIQV